jgi:hypothetical protein
MPWRPRAAGAKGRESRLTREVGGNPTKETEKTRERRLRKREPNQGNMKGGALAKFLLCPLSLFSATSARGARK